MYDCFKNSKYNFRKHCLTAVNNKVNIDLKKCNLLYKNNNKGSMWNVIKQHRKRTDSDHNCISVNTLKDYFTDFILFSYCKTTENDLVSSLRKQVENKVSMIENVTYDFVFTEHLMRQFIGNLKTNCAPGADGITSEHLKYALQSELSVHLCKLLTLCFNYGIVPESFYELRVFSCLY